ncbi:unnamed protein product, partial [Gongylonema pulchrum]|uniref:Defective in cullin neddylation protein n=1 Tax=Gongylonema pulchrum TaxID=637853 RepID=A0A183EVQ7_9BILA
MKASAFLYLRGQTHEERLPPKKRIKNLCEKFPLDVTPKDIQYFLSNIFGIFQDIAQYSGDNRDEARRAGLGVPRTCEIMNNASEPSRMKRIKAVMDFYKSFFESAETCNDNSYSSYMEMMRNVTYDPPDYDRSSARGWIWQCCTQLGFMQTTDGGKSAFGSAVPLE